jgi:hypothetical protein
LSANFKISSAIPLWQYDLQEFFEHENQKFPPSLSQNGSLNTGVKSQLMSILETGHEMPNSVPTVDSLVIDGASLVYSKQPGHGCKVL